MSAQAEYQALCLIPTDQWLETAAFGPARQEAPVPTLPGQPGVQCRVMRAGRQQQLLTIGVDAGQRHLLGKGRYLPSADARGPMARAERPRGPGHRPVTADCSKAVTPSRREGVATDDGAREHLLAPKEARHSRYMQLGRNARYSRSAMEGMPRACRPPSTTREVADVPRSHWRDGAERERDSAAHCTTPRRPSMRPPLRREQSQAVLADGVLAEAADERRCLSSELVGPRQAGGVALGARG
jgi:hypothetical protein